MASPSPTSPPNPSPLIAPLPGLLLAAVVAAAGFGVRALELPGLSKISPLMLAIVIGMNGYRSMSLLTEAAQRTATAEAMGMANELDGWNRRAISVVQVMRDAAEGGLFGRRAESLAFLRA